MLMSNSLIRFGPLNIVLDSNFKQDLQVPFYLTYSFLKCMERRLDDLYIYQECCVICITL